MSTHTHTHAKTTHTTLTTHAWHFLCVCENRISVHSAPCEGPHFVAAVIEPQSAFSACENVSDDEVCVQNGGGGAHSGIVPLTDRSPIAIATTTIVEKDEYSDGRIRSENSMVAHASQHTITKHTTTTRLSRDHGSRSGGGDDDADDSPSR